MLRQPGTCGPAVSCSFADQPKLVGTGIGVGGARFSPLGFPLPAALATQLLNSAAESAPHRAVIRLYRSGGPLPREARNLGGKEFPPDLSL